MGATKLDQSGGYNDFMEIYKVFVLARKEFEEKGEGSRGDIYVKHCLRIETICQSLGIDSARYLTELAGILLYPKGR